MKKLLRILLFFIASNIFYSCQKEPAPEIDFREAFVGTYNVSALTYRYTQWVGYSDSLSWDTTLTVKIVDTSQVHIKIYDKIMIYNPTDNIPNTFWEDAFVGGHNEAFATFFEPDSIYFEYKTGGLALKKYYIFKGRKQ